MRKHQNIFSAIAVKVAREERFGQHALLARDAERLGIEDAEMIVGKVIIAFVNPEIQGAPAVFIGPFNYRYHFIAVHIVGI